MGKALAFIPMSIPESSGFFVRAWLPEETLGQQNGRALVFLVQNNKSLHEIANRKRYFIRVP